MRLTTRVNGREVSVDIAADARLIDVLREALDLKGTKEGCAEGECGACTVIVDDLAVNSCLLLATQVEGRSITTIEGLSDGAALSRLQQKFVEHGAVQCGFCTPGMLLSATALLARNPTPTHDDIRRALAGNLCRCTGYAAVVEAVAAAADPGAGR